MTNKVKLKLVCSPKISADTALNIGSTESSGLDVKSMNSVIIRPNQTVLVSTGLTLAYLDKGYEIQVRPRSGNSLKTPLRIANSPGTIDNDYRGEIKIIVTNISNEQFHINKGFKIAQLVISPVVIAKDINIEFVSEITKDNNDRLDRGFGSSGFG